MSINWQQPFVRVAWEARLVLVGFLLGTLGLFGTAVTLVVRDSFTGGAVIFHLGATLGAVLLSFVLLRVSKRVLGSYYPLWRPLAMLSLQFRFLGRISREATRILGFPDALGNGLAWSLPASFVVDFLVIILWPFN
ncbi:MAG: hypothetical protein M3280_09115 [Actinomycetota bacterium]|nr:hypothetical protein [Actinomycetota bacterium]